MWPMKSFTKKQHRTKRNLRKIDFWIARIEIIIKKQSMLRLMDLKNSLVIEINR